jgi:hypothetical protein
MRATSLAIAAAGALAAVAVGAAVVLTDRAPYPYGQRRVLDLPLPLLSTRRLDVLLQPRPGIWPARRRCRSPTAISTRPTW